MDNIRKKSVIQLAFGYVSAMAILFGLFHIFGGNLVQLIVTGFTGAVLCVCRVRIKNCTVLSLIVAHGIYDTLITVWGDLP